MKKITIVILGVFFIALTANAFAGGDLVGDIKSSLGGIQKAAYDTIVVKPYQAGVSVGQAVMPYVTSLNDLGKKSGIGRPASKVFTPDKIQAVREAIGTSINEVRRAWDNQPKMKLEERSIKNAGNIVGDLITSAGIGKPASKELMISQKKAFREVAGNTILDAWNNQKLSLINRSIENTSAPKTTANNASLAVSGQGKSFASGQLKTAPMLRKGNY
ncbi:MAG: hypothetical protein NTY14_00455 [Candidatus Omnitrophica bacterium]|nr:hypothetical protein [Candidatus Omnitrophota bacterium]